LIVVTRVAKHAHGLIHVPLLGLQSRCISQGVMSCRGIEGSDQLGGTWLAQNERITQYALDVIPLGLTLVWIERDHVIRAVVQPIQGHSPERRMIGHGHIEERPVERVAVALARIDSDRPVCSAGSNPPQDIQRQVRAHAAVVTLAGRCGRTARSRRAGGRLRLSRELLQPRVGHDSGVSLHRLPVRNAGNKRGGRHKQESQDHYRARKFHGPLGKFERTVWKCWSLGESRAQVPLHFRLDVRISRLLAVLVSTYRSSRVEELVVELTFTPGAALPSRGIE
jgi:hypothetical protein